MLLLPRIQIRVIHAECFHTELFDHNWRVICFTYCHSSQSSQVYFLANTEMFYKHLTLVGIISWGKMYESHAQGKIVKTKMKLRCAFLSSEQKFPLLESVFSEQKENKE